MKLRLEEPTLGVLRLERQYGYRPSRLDLGFPAAREVTEDRVNAPGVIDSTVLFGARPVAVNLAVVGDSDGETTRGVTRTALLSKLAAYCIPGLRSYLYVDAEDGTVERRVQVRGTSVGAPLDLPGYADVSVGWSAPDGYLENGTLQSVTVNPVLPSDPGRTYPKTYPFSYPKLSSAGAMGVANSGNLPAAPVYRIYGPCTNPGIVNPDTGDVTQFGGTALTGTLALNSSQYIEVDVRNATAVFNGDPNQPAYQYLDLTQQGGFAWLAPGANRLRLVTTSYDDGCHVDVMYRSAWIL